MENGKDVSAESPIGCSSAMERFVSNLLTILDSASYQRALVAALMPVLLSVACSGTDRNPPDDEAIASILSALKAGCDNGYIYDVHNNVYEECSVDHADHSDEHENF